MKRKIGKVSTLVFVLLAVSTLLLSGYMWADPETPNLLIYGMTGTACYARFVSTDTLKVWDAVASTPALVAVKDFDDTDVAMTSYAVNALTDNTSKLGGWLLNIPSTLPDGNYDVLIYNSSSVASTDAIYRGYRCKIRNQKIYKIIDL